MTGNDPHLLQWITMASVAIVGFILKMVTTNFIKRQQIIERRMNHFERNAITHDDLTRMESKVDRLTDRFDRHFDKGTNK